MLSQWVALAYLRMGINLARHFSGNVQVLSVSVWLRCAVLPRSIAISPTVYNAWSSWVKTKWLNFGADGECFWSKVLYLIICEYQMVKVIIALNACPKFCYAFFRMNSQPAFVHDQRQVPLKISRLPPASSPLCIYLSCNCAVLSALIFSTSELFLANLNSSTTTISLNVKTTSARPFDVWG